jgi:hypothetical protein
MAKADEAEKMQQFFRREHNGSPSITEKVLLPKKHIALAIGL